RKPVGHQHLAESLAHPVQFESGCHAFVGLRSPFTGTSGLNLLSTSVMSQGNWLPGRHWPPLIFCSAMPGCGPVVKSSGPLIPLIFMFFSLSATSSRRQAEEHEDQ